MEYSLNEWIVFFAAYAFGGWLLESTYASVKAGRFVNRGFLNGPLTPIYGFGAVGILAVAQWLRAHVHDAAAATLLLFILSAVLTTLLEYAAGWLLEKVFHQKWWDYSDNRWNLHGYVCAGYSLLWGGMAILLVRILHPVTEWALSGFSAQDFQTGAWLFAVYLAADTLYTASTQLRDRRKETASDGEAADVGYRQCVEDLLAQEEVQRMADFIQHGRTTCLDHCLSVSYTSYRICRRLGLDSRSAARGGLLHDLFLYDWHVPDPNRKWHGFKHPRIALTNADRCFSLNPVERDIILRHMWPLTPVPPRYPEAFVVTMADKYVTVKEFMARVRLSFRLS